VLLAVSTSGTSVNVVRAVEVAKAKGLQVVGLTGQSGGTLKRLADICIRAPEQETYLVQELHLPIYHTLCAIIEDRLFASSIDA
jgi:D-sedoheptulose 7-phosphate isomerase